MLKEVFINLASNYNSEKELVNKLWDEIEMEYASFTRFYHNLSHLNALYTELEKVKDKIDDYNSVLFALFYHDFVYDPLKNDNEEKSAVIAQKRLDNLGLKNELIDKVATLILATKGHQQSTNNDVNLFIDADLSILGKEWDLYTKYSRCIRQEYRTYADNVYNAGRTKVLHHFLNMDRIYKTDFFFDLYEEGARINMEKELSMLQN